MGLLIKAFIPHYWGIVLTIGTVYHSIVFSRLIVRWIRQFAEKKFGKLPGPVRRFLIQLVAPVRRFLDQLVNSVRAFHARWELSLKFYQAAIICMSSAAVITGLVTQSWYVFALGAAAVFLSLKLYGREEKGSPLLKKVMLFAIGWLLVPYLIYVLLNMVQ